MMMSLIFQQILSSLDEIQVTDGGRLYNVVILLQLLQEVKETGPSCKFRHNILSN